MTEFKYNRVLVILIVLGLLAALTVGWQRHVVEVNNTTVEMVIDYEEVVELAQMEGVPVRELMGRFKEAGITSLAVYETTLEKLHKSGRLTAISGADILHGYRAGTLSGQWWRALVEAGRINPDDVYVMGRERVLFEEVESDLVRRLSPERVTVLSEGGEIWILAAKANYEKILKWNLGLSSGEMQEVAGQGFFVVARPSNYTKVRPEDVRAVFDRMAGIDNISSIMFVGEEVLGYPDQLPLTAESMKARGLTLAMIEHPLQLQFLKQDGLVELAALNGYQSARVYVIPKSEQPKLEIQQAIQRWVGTDRERNIRINLLRKFDKPQIGKTLVETNLDYISGVKRGLIEKGFSIGRAGVYQAYFPSRLLLALIIIGATAAGVLFLSLLRPFRVQYQYLLLAITAAILIFPILKGSGNVVRQAVALASAVLFPVLAMTYQLDRWRSSEPYAGTSVMRVIIDGAVSLSRTVLLAIVGGFYVAAVLGDVRFFLEMEIYRGVKLTFVAPLILMALVYLTRYRIFGEETDQPRNIWQQVGVLLNYPVYVKTLLVLAVAGLGAWVFVGRSGHTAGVPVPGIEIKLRAFLERVMYARPREKEFLIGHPAFFLALMATRRQWPRALHFSLVIVATIGLGSLVETFAHLRTPVLMSFVRGLDGLLVGICFGILAVVGVQVLHYLSLLLGRRPTAHE